MNIADRYAALEVQIEALEAEMGKLRKEIIKEGCAQIEGETAIVTLSLAERTMKIVRSWLAAKRLSSKPCASNSSWQREPEP